MKDFSEFFKEDCKKLPKKDSGGFAPYFEANGRKYKIRSASEGIPIKRWTAYEKLNLMFGYNATIDKLYQNQQLTKGMLNDILLQRAESSYSVIDVIQHQDSILAGLIDFSKARVNKAFYLCTIFIVQEGEDIHNWDSDLAEQKIDDWIKEGFDSTDFFLLARIFSPQWNRIITVETGTG